MNKLFLFSFLFLAFSCTPDGRFDEKYDGDTNIVIDQPVDTFSVKRTKPSDPGIDPVADKTNSAKDSAASEKIVQVNAGTNDDPSVIILNPDIGPSFPGGAGAMDAFIIKRKIYPLVAFQNEIKGTVLVKFVVEKDGTISGIKILQGLGYGCDESATQLVRSMPAWIPGQKNGKPVRCNVTLPVSFGN